MMPNTPLQGKIIATTQRLILQEFTLNDAEFIQKLLNTPDWIKYIGDRNIKNIHNAEGYLMDKIMPSYSKNNFGLWCVRLSTGQAVGMCGLVQRPDFTDIGFAFLPEYCHAGYGFEAATATVAYAKKIEFAHLAAITLECNMASVALLRKLGFIFKKNITMPNTPEWLMFFELEL